MNSKIFFILAWRNLWRNRNRTLITASSVFFASTLAILMSSLQMGVFDNFLKNVVSYYTGYIQIHKNGYWDEQLIDNSFVHNDSLYNQILLSEKISGIAPRLENYLLASSSVKTQGVFTIGINPVEENKLTGLSEKIIEGQYLTQDDKDILISEGLKKKFQLNLNDTVVLLGQGFHGISAAGKYKIKGIAKFGSPEINNRTIFLSLKEAQNLFSAENIVTSYSININEPDEVDEIKSSLYFLDTSKYEIMSWKEMLPEIDQHIKIDRISFYVMFAILYIVVAFGVFGTIIMMLKERQFEFGVITAIGMKKSQLAFLLTLETIIISLLGIIAGILFSIPVVNILSTYPIQFGGKLAEAYANYGFEPIFPTSTNPEHFYIQALIILGIAIVISFYPLVKALTINPIKALRN